MDEKARAEARILDEMIFEKLAGLDEPPHWIWALLRLRPFTAWKHYKQRKAWLAERRASQKAIDEVNDFTRQKMREHYEQRDSLASLVRKTRPTSRFEEPFIQKIRPPISITNDELDGPCVNDEKNPTKREP